MRWQDTSFSKAGNIFSYPATKLPAAGTIPPELGHLRELRVLWLNVNQLTGAFFFFKQKTAYEIASCLVGSEMCIRDRTHSKCFIGKVKLLPTDSPLSWFPQSFSSISAASFPSSGRMEPVSVKNKHD